MRFGLDESIYWTLSQVVTTIIYNTLRLHFEFATLGRTMSATRKHTISLLTSLFCIQLSDSVFTLLGCSLRNCAQSSQLCWLSLTLRPTVSRPLYLGMKHLSWAYDQLFITLWQLPSCFMWAALSDERRGLYFLYAAGPCQFSLSLIRVPWDSHHI
jgi:hypothetical protein